MAKCLKITAANWSDEFVTVYINDKMFTIDNSHPSFDKVIAELQQPKNKVNPDRIKSLMSIKSAIKQFSSDRLKIDGCGVSYNGFALHGVLVDKIVDLYRNGLDFERFAKFLENLMDNPSKRAVDELYSFLTYVQLPITEDGCFIGYKKVTDNYRDYYSGNFDNSPGQRVFMLRNMVDDQKENTCSRGLHVGSLQYADKEFYPGQGRVILVKVNPKDVVSVPSDYNGQKLRASEYVVLNDYEV